MSVEQVNTNSDVDPYDDDYTLGAADKAAGVPVHITGTDVVSVSESAEYGSWQTFPINATWQPAQILKRNLRRYKAIIMCVPGFAAGQSLSSTGSTGTEPAAGTVVTSEALAGGVYTVNWTVGISSVNAGVANNFGLYNGATLVATSINPVTIGSYPQIPVQVVIPAAGATLAIKAIASETTLTIYSATEVANGAAQPVTDGVILGTQQQAQGNQVLSAPLGGFLPVGATITVENQQEVWAAYPTANTDSVKLLVLDQLYAASDEKKS